MNCGKCKHWKFNLRFPIGLNVICNRLKLPIQVAADVCMKEATAIVMGNRKKESGVKYAKKKRLESSVVYAKPWPGINRGYGSLTRGEW